MTTPRPVTAVAQRRGTNRLQELPHCTSIPPELQNYCTEKARHWKMSTLGVQYVHTMTPPQRDVVTDRSSGHRVSSTPPSPLTRATPASVATPSGSGGPIQQPAAPTARTTLAVHKDIYADGWKNGEGTSRGDKLLQRPQKPRRSELEEKRSITRMHNNRPTHAQRTEGPNQRE